MASIWLVTSGQYSDYHVVAAFSSKLRATTWIGGVPDYDVEEFVVDDPDKPARQLGLRGWMSLESSDLWELDECEYGEYGIESARQVSVYPSWRSNKIPALHTHFDYGDRECALKTLSEMRAALIASGHHVMDGDVYNRDLSLKTRGTGRRLV